MRSADGCARQHADRALRAGGSARSLVLLSLSLYVYTEFTKHAVTQIILVAGKHEQDVSALIQYVVVAFAGGDFFDGSEDSFLNRAHQLTLPREQLSVRSEETLAERLDLAARFCDGFFLLLLLFVRVQKLTRLVFLLEIFDAVASILDLGSPLLLHLIQVLLNGFVLRQPVQDVLAVDVADLLLRLKGRGANARPEQEC